MSHASRSVSRKHKMLQRRLKSLGSQLPSYPRGPAPQRGRKPPIVHKPADRAGRGRARDEAMTAISRALEAQRLNRE